MKKLLPNHPAFAVAFFAMTCVAAGAAATNDTSADFPYVVNYELGKAEFAAGDSITITALHGTREVITTNETYCVEGTYTLGSRDKAELCFFATTSGNSGPTPVDPRQTVHVTRGTGTFRLIKTMTEDGYLHLSFYNGGAISGVYFGQGEWVLRQKGFSHPDEPSRSPDNSSSATASAASSSDPNHAMLEYLGNPVPPPSGMDAAYSKRGLNDALQLAAKNAGISFKRIEIDDSEFPFIVGVTCGEGDWANLANQMKKMTGYEYNGSIGSSTCNAFNLVPSSSFPSETSQRIGRRLWLREQMLFDRISSQQ